MFLFLAVVLECSLQAQPAELARMGFCTPFIDMRAPSRFQPLMITDDGSQAYAVSYNAPMITWKIGVNDDLIILFGVDSLDQPRTMAWRGWPGGGYLPYAPGEPKLVGFLDSYRPVIWNHMSDVGLPSRISMLGWIDVSSGTSGTGALMFFERKSYVFEQLDIASRDLYLRATESRDMLRAFSISTDRLQVREISLPPRAKRYVELANQWPASAGYRWAVKAERKTDPATGRSKVERVVEYDLETGRGTTIPLSFGDQHSFAYIGQDLFFYERILARDAGGEEIRNVRGEPTYADDLWMWDRKNGVPVRIGRYSIQGSSPNGRYMVLKGDGRLWFIRRTP